MRNPLVWLLAAACLVLASCVGVERNPNSALPGNSPASWEGRTLGVPFN